VSILATELTDYLAQKDSRMELNIAKETIERLADGINPATGEVLPKEGPYNDPLVVRALFTILESIKAIRPAARTAEQRQNDNVENGRPRNAGLPWTEEQRAEAAVKFKKGSSIIELAECFERTSGAITAELVKQGLIDSTEGTGYRRN
jgi:hypothetical protein